MRVQISVYFSDDFDLKAIVYLNQEKGCYEVDYAKNGLIIATESYIDHNLQYHEDAAENYVLGVKTL
jgi:hypothetical protein